MASDEAFLDDLQRLVQRLNELPDTRATTQTPLGELVAEFLGADPQALPITRDTVGPHRLVDVSIALESLAADDPASRLVGVAGGQERNFEDFQGLLRHRSSTFSPGPVEYAAVATGPDRTRQVIAFGIQLLHTGAGALAVLLRAPSAMHGREGVTIEVLASSADAGATPADHPFLPTHTHRFST